MIHQIGNLAKMEMNWLEHWVISITRLLCHQTCEVLLLQIGKYITKYDLNLTFTMMG